MLELPPITSGQPLLDTIHHTDLLTLCGALPSQSVDMIVLDPPYGMGIDEWDNPLEVRAVIPLVERLLKPTGFLFLFNQMPYMVEWLHYLSKSNFLYRDHIVWIKRLLTSPTQPILRSHESCFIYAKSKSSVYKKTDGPYEDIKLPNWLHGLISADGLDRYIKDLRLKASGEKPSTIRRVNTGNKAYSHLQVSELDRSPEFSNFTNAWSFYPDAAANKSNNSIHPTMKPVELMKRAIELLTNPGEIILDPCVGSGTTAVAARQTGRHFIGGDITLEYVDIARARLAKPYTPPLFLEVGEMVAV